MKPTIYEMSDADHLRRIAQNDYMIDGKYLADGVLLLAIADRVARELEPASPTDRDATLRDFAERVLETLRRPPQEFIGKTAGELVCQLAEHAIALDLVDGKPEPRR